VASSEVVDRRGFFKVGAALLGSYVPLFTGRSAWPVIDPSDRLDRIGIQLYSLRRELAKDFERTLARVAEIGYTEVEFAGYYDRTPAQVKAALERTGLRAPSAHIPISLLRESWAKTLDEARVMGHRYLIVPSIPEDELATADGVTRVAELFQRAGAEAKAAGLRLGFHNHDVDFMPIGGRGGKAPFDLLLEKTDPAHVAFELDLYWISKAGRDPLAYFARYPGRFELVHVKDSGGPPEHRMVDVGRGTIDFKRIFARRREAGIQHFFVEHDDPPDPLGFARASYTFLSRLEF
jgi:sugar phosphate isomerase/epimerase